MIMKVSKGKCWLQVHTRFDKKRWEKIIIECPDQAVKMPQYLKNKPDYMLGLIKKKAQVLNIVSESLKNDDDFVRRAISINPKALAFSPNKFKNEPELVLKALHDDMWYGNLARPFFFASHHLQQDLDFTERAIRTNRWVFDRLPIQDQCQERLVLCYLSIMTETKLGIQFLAQNHFSELLEDQSFVEKAFEINPDVKRIIENKNNIDLYSMSQKKYTVQS